MKEVRSKSNREPTTIVRVGSPLPKIVRGPTKRCNIETKGIAYAIGEDGLNLITKELNRFATAFRFSA